MSRGGRGGGRGRGRGGGGGGGAGGGGGSNILATLPPELMGEMPLLFSKEPTALYPEMEISIQSKHESFEQEQIDAARIYRELLKDSAYYLLPPPPPKDIQRYSDKYRKDTATRGMSLRQIKTSLAFFPDELHGVIDASKASKASRKLRTAKVTFDLSAFDALENEDAAEDSDDGLRKRTKTGEEGEEKKGEREGSGEEPEDEDEENDEGEAEDETDYGNSYFDNGEADDVDDYGGDDDGDRGGDYY